MSRGVTINVDGRKLDEAIRKIEGKNYKGTKISTFILRKDFSYYSKVVRTGVCNKEVFNTLCNYYDLNEADYIITEPVVVETEKKSETEVPATNEALITLLTNLYKVERDNGNILIEMLEEMEKLNKKLDNIPEITAVVGQIEEHTQQTAECSVKSIATIGEIRSNVNILQGRVKDIAVKVGVKNEKTN